MKDIRYGYAEVRAFHPTDDAGNDPRNDDFLVLQRRFYQERKTYCIDKLPVREKE
jgi:DNA-binding SARP family transcriptional activator